MDQPRVSKERRKRSSLPPGPAANLGSTPAREQQAVLLCVVSGMPAEAGRELG